ncbi:DoxX family protein [Rossellomorea sp. BNER]|uniref:DoxX family protein n=1 Tax=Rossellomorea sp. BNER TaxID=2962031 RepID=UPI003AF2B00C|nr:DoxX family protein [Rossellomorea sp. BNER]
MGILSTVLQTLLILYFLFSGVSKVIGAKYWVDIFNQIKLPQWFRAVTGVIQFVGAVALIIGYWVPEAVAWGGIWLGITMLLACLAHVRVKDSIGKTMPSIVFLAIIIVLVIINAESL